ncbi:alpha/beta fold hydrolase [Streptomyces sp. CA-106110]|uniref:alpha/beta fold hydrolase n=1 Tax=Streptomyces sp. CA-106110 TaxID=3240044 RepID=UPI003D94112D
MTEAERSTMVVRLDQGPVEYRLEQRGGPVVVVLHGGHMRASLVLGEEVFAESGYTVLAPSRPGYGRTPLSTGTSVSGFADVTRALCEHLGIAKVAAVVGISGGGPTAATMAARHPDLVERLILQSAVGWLAWPDRSTRIGAHVVFAAATEQATWGAMRGLMRLAPETCLRLLLRDLSTLPVRDVVAALRAQDRATLVALFSRMRSGSGFINDLQPAPDVTTEVGQPTLVIATRKDGAVPFAHAQSLAAVIAHAELVESQADSHFIWFGHDWPTIAETIRTFLTTDPPQPLQSVPQT